MKKAISLLSGGLDSATLLWHLKGKYEVHALTVRYGRVNRMEVKASKALARRAHVVEHIIVDLSVLMELEVHEPGGSARLGVPSSYIPAINAVLFGIAAHYAELRGASMIFTGQNMEDRFPDSGKDFIRAFNRVIALGKPPRLRLSAKVAAPFIDMKKSEIVSLARELGVPMGLLWSCHMDGTSPCGSCDGCTALAKAMREAG